MSREPDPGTGGTIGTRAPRLDHIAIAVHDLESARDRFRSLLGCESSPIEHIPSENVRVCFFSLANCRIELVAPDGPEGPIHDFLERGGRGLHHIALTPAGDAPLANERARLESAGLRLAPGGVRRGSAGREILFIHPRSAEGALIELIGSRSADRRDEDES